MRILIISPICPFPVNSGGRVRIIEIFRGLSRDHEVTFVFPFHPTDKLSLEEIDNDYISIHPVLSPSNKSIRKLIALLSFQPYHYSLWYSRNLQKKIDELINSTHFDLVYCNFIYTLPYIVGRGLKIVVDQHNVDREYIQRKVSFYKKQRNLFMYWISLIDLWKTIRFEDKLLPSLSGIVCVSKDDYDYTRVYTGSKIANLLIAPNGVNTNHYVPMAKINEKPNTITLGFLGSLNLKLNQDAVLILCKEILPRVQTCLKEYNVSALIIGRDPPKNLRTLVHNNYKNQITITGTVPDVLPYLHKVDILVLPLRHGAGSKLRVMEAFSTGICIVGSPLAFIGIDGFIGGKHALVAESVDQFVEAIYYLINNIDVIKQMAADCRNLITNHYEWSTITHNLSLSLKLIYKLE